ncbi:MAG: hypothetical protein JXB44_05830 [Calditrichaceae bacterium]|nr:hypothetical protein [Calditrichaceae bacterium]RQV95866.1 MAG: hypothetical protein EH224_06300 [Calditrichota bacterium]
MSDIPGFISQEEYDEFNREKRFIERSVIEEDSGSDDARSKAIVWQLKHYIQTKIKVIKKKKKYSLNVS